MGKDAETDRVMEESIATLKKLGATIIDPVVYPDFLLQGRTSMFLTVLNADFKAQISGYLANVAKHKPGYPKSFAELVAKYGSEQTTLFMRETIDYAERLTRAALEKLPDGEWSFEDVLDSDGAGSGPVRIRATVRIRGDELSVDFTGTDTQAVGPINCTLTGLVTGVRCVFKAITNPELPANGGCFRPLQIVCPPGTFISAQSPAPVSLYYESLLAAMDVMWKALAPAMPGRLPAGHQRSVNATFVAGLHPDTGDLFVMGEPLVGGWGAAPYRDGDNGQFCCANGETYNIPVELFEELVPREAGLEKLRDRGDQPLPVPQGEDVREGRQRRRVHPGDVAAD